MTDDLWQPLTKPTGNGGAKPRADACRCRFKRSEPGPYLWCLNCGGRIVDEERARRGRTNRNRGNAIEREIGARLGLRRVGQFGTGTDLDHPLWAVQVKSGGSFPERLWRWLQGVERNAGQTPLLVITDAPGPGHRRRALVVLDIDEWVGLHGPTEDVA